MNSLPFNSIEPMLVSSLAQLAAAGAKVSSSFEELVGSAGELAAAEKAFLAVRYAVPDGGDYEDEEENQQVEDALTLCEAAEFDLASALERTLGEMLEQERVLDEARRTLLQIKGALQERTHELSPPMELGPKPGCVCS